MKKGLELTPRTMKERELLEFQKNYFKLSSKERALEKKKFNTAICEMSGKKIPTDISHLPTHKMGGSIRRGEDFLSYKLDHGLILTITDRFYSATIIDNKGSIVATNSSTSVGKDGVNKLITKLLKK